MHILSRECISCLILRQSLKMNATNLFGDAGKLFEEVCATYKKTEAEVNEDVDIIKKWLETQPHLPEMMRDSHIRNFLILNKFSIENTKKKIDMYYTIRSLIPDLFEDCNPKSPRVRELQKYGVAGIHPQLFQGKYRIYMARLLRPPTTVQAEEVIQLMVCAAEVRLHEDCFSHDVFILDAKHIQLSDVLKVTPTIILKARAIYEKVFSLRVKAAYVYNAPPYISRAMQLLKQLLKPKIFERIHIFENDDILKELFTTDTLPKDYGGNGPSLEELRDIMLKKFDEHQDRFDQLDKMRVDESLRPDKLVNDDILGFYGNFKKLSVD